MQALLKTEPEEMHDEIVDVITVTPPCQALKVKEEEQEADMEPKFFLGPSVSAQFVSEAAQQVSGFWGHRRANKGNPFAPPGDVASLSDRGELPASRGGEKRV